MKNIINVEVKNARQLRLLADFLESDDFDTESNLINLQAEKEIAEAIDSYRPGFRGGWISSVALVKMLIEKNKCLPLPSKLEMIMERIGYVSWGRAPRAIPQEGNMRPYLWVEKDMQDPWFLKSFSEQDIESGDYLTAQSENVEDYYFPQDEPFEDYLSSQGWS